MATAAPAKSRWIVNPWVDLFAVVSLLAFAVFLAFYLSGYRQRTDLVVTAAYLLQVVCNWPHFAASYVRLYSSWQNVREYASVAVYWPVVLVGAVIGTLLYPDLVGPWFAKTFLLWAGHHYSGQTYGIALIYCRKYGFTLQNWEKWIVRGPIWMSYIFPVADMELRPGASSFYAVNMPSLASASEKWFGWLPPQGLVGLLPWVYGVTVVVFLAWALWRRLGARAQQWLPLASWITVGAQMLWYDRIALTPSFYEFVPFFHCLQYLVVITAFHRHTWMREGRNNTVAFLQYFGVLILLGGFLFEAVPVAISHVGIATGVSYAAILSFINLHHYLIDGVIWKLRKPEVARALV